MAEYQKEKGDAMHCVIRVWMCITWIANKN